MPNANANGATRVPLVSLSSRSGDGALLFGADRFVGPRLQAYGSLDDDGVRVAV